MGKADYSPDPNCRLEGVIEAIRERRKPESSLGVVACLACYGIFDIHFDVGEGPRIENRVFIPCIKGYSSDLDSSAEG